MLCCTLYNCIIHKFFGGVIYMELSEVVKKVRIELGLFQEGLALEPHVGFTSVNRWENGHTKPNQIARHALTELCKGKKINQDLIKTLENSKGLFHIQKN